MGHGLSLYVAWFAVVVWVRLVAAGGGQLQQAQPRVDMEVVFALIGRNAEDKLPHVLRNIERLSAHFRRAHTLLVENDSLDRTKRVFDDWAWDAGGARISFKARTRAPKAMTVLAHARNLYLRALLHPKYRAADLVVVVDTDMCHLWDVRAMAALIVKLAPGMGTQWHAVTANGACGWYDAQGQPAPMRSPAARPVYCDLFALHDVKNAIYEEHTIWLAGGCNVTGIAPCEVMNGVALVPVRSAFGGFGMYAAKLLRTAFNSFSDKRCMYASNGTVCEHVPWHQCLVQNWGARLFIAPDLLVDWEGCEGPVQQ